MLYNDASLTLKFEQHVLCRCERKKLTIVKYENVSYGCFILL